MVRLSLTHLCKIPKNSLGCYLPDLSNEHQVAYWSEHTVAQGWLREGALPLSLSRVLAPALVARGVEMMGTLAFPSWIAQRLMVVRSVVLLAARPSATGDPGTNLSPLTARLLGNPAAYLRPSTSFTLCRGCHWLSRPQITPRRPSMLSGSLCLSSLSHWPLGQDRRTSCTPSNNSHWSIEAGMPPRWIARGASGGGVVSGWPCKL
ncbi:hypothetical protein F5Y08DRAFT_80472 [Xylaria arbuscula]|nr:hypothetical protein F5Y08DRAFT_80472 [Xylaria arbuscula]